MNGDHVRLLQKQFWCSHCGASEPLNLPVEVRALAERGKAFMAKHRRCKKPEAST